MRWRWQLGSREQRAGDRERTAGDAPRSAGGRVEREEVELFLAAASRRAGAVPPCRSPSTPGAAPPLANLTRDRPAQPEPRARRVVIAEDEALIRMDLAEMLGEQGYDVVGQAGDGAGPSSWPRSCGPTWSSWTSRCRSSTGSPRPSGSRRSGSPRWSSSPPSPSASWSSGPATPARWPTSSSRSRQADLVPAIEMAVSRFAELQRSSTEVADLGEPAGDPQGGRPGQGGAPGASWA